MKFLDYAKQYHNFDVFLVLIDDAGYTDEEIMEKFEVSKQRIYDARKRLEPVFKALEQIQPYKRNVGDPNINMIVQAFADTFGTTKVSAYDRYAAKRLHVKYGAETIVKVIKALGQFGGEQYCPVVNNVSQVEIKWVQIGKFLQTQSGNGVMDIA